MNKIYLGMIGCVILTSCYRYKAIENKKIEYLNIKEILTTSENPDIIDIQKARVFSTKDLVENAKIRYIPLESKKLIGEVRKMEVTENGIYIMDSFLSQAVFAFDKQGKLKYCIDDKGSGPDEFVSIWDIQVDEERKEIMINDALGYSYIYYSLVDGSFIRKERAIQNCYVSKINNLYFNILSYGQDFNDSEDWQLLITDQDSVLYKAFKLKPIQKNNFMSNNIFCNDKKEMFYTPLYSDTIYQLNKDLLFTSRYVIKQNKSIWKESLKEMGNDEISRMIKEEDYTQFTGKIFETETSLIFSVSIGYNGGIVNIPYVLNKSNDDLIKWDVTRLHKKEDLHDFISFPQAVYKNEFYSIASIGENHELPNLSPALSAILPSDSEDSNPIISIYRFDD